MSTSRPILEQQSMIIIVVRILNLCSTSGPTANGGPGLPRAKPTSFPKPLSAFQWTLLPSLPASSKVIFMIIMGDSMGMTMRSMMSINYQHDCCCRISQTMPTTSCACPDDMKLSKDWRTCVAKNPAKKTSTTTAPVPPKKKPITTRGTTSRGMKSETTETPILHHGEADVKPVAQEDSRCSLKSYRLYFILVLKIRRQSFKKASLMKMFRIFFGNISS